MIIITRKNQKLKFFTEPTGNETFPKSTDIFNNFKEALLLPRRISGIEQNVFLTFLMSLTKYPIGTMTDLFVFIPK